MKNKRAVCLVAVMILLFMVGCGGKDPSVKRTIKGLQTYYEMSDGTWKCGDHIYRYRLEFSGNLNAQGKRPIIVYLSNLEQISQDRAWKASGLHSDSKDYFSIDEAVLVEMNVQ